MPVANGSQRELLYIDKDDCSPSTFVDRELRELFLSGLTASDLDLAGSEGFFWDVVREISVLGRLEREGL